MANKQIIITDNLYNLKYDEWYKEYYSVYWNQNEHIFKNLLEDPNTDVVINFNDKKDKRQKETKCSKHIRLNFVPFITDSKPTGKLIFNQNKDSTSFFNVNFSRSDYPETENSKPSEFEFNGSFNNFSISNAGFKTIKINQQFTTAGYIHIIVSDNLLENLDINSPISFTLKNLSGKNIKQVNIKSDNCIFYTEHLNVKSIDKINFLNTKTLNLCFDDYILSSLSYKSPDSLSIGLQEQLKSLSEHINPNCDIIFNPETNIKCYTFLPSRKNSITIKELFGLDDSVKELHTTPYELIYKMWLYKTNQYQKNIQNVKYISEEYLQKLKPAKQEVKDKNIKIK